MSAIALRFVEALPKITEEGFRKRFNQAVMLNPDIYSTLWWEEEVFEDFQDIKNKIREYYQDVATKGNAMLLWFS
ncbi:MAG: YfbM family protein [Hassallia sp. WJT32-NPBG1]|jgi:hypothetical protein|nr:YfbM family protein [Hassallia sp. WJT32-NPBG1]